MLRKIEGRKRRGCDRRWDGWMASHSMDISLSKLWEMVTEKPGVLQSMGSQRAGHD